MHRSRAAHPAGCRGPPLWSVCRKKSCFLSGGRRWFRWSNKEAAGKIEENEGHTEQWDRLTYLKCRERGKKGLHFIQNSICSLIITSRCVFSLKKYLTGISTVVCWNLQHWRVSNLGFQIIMRRDFYFPLGPLLVVALTTSSSEL